jgi:hypothetical protein
MVVNFRACEISWGVCKFINIFKHEKKSNKYKAKNLQ